jgi:biotin-(acetyl-CoA carboxylase) ligase
MAPADGRAGLGAVRLPPLLTPHMATPGSHAFETAVIGAQGGQLGAGDVVLAPGVNAAAMAIVLEPEVVSTTARQMAPLMAVALGDALGGLLPPKVAIEHRWPGRVLLNGGEAGVVRLAQAAAGPEQVADWLVVGIELRLAFEGVEAEPGQRPGRTSVGEEGGGELTAEEILAATASHFLAWLDIWQADGLEPVAKAWLFRCEGQSAPAAFEAGDGRAGVTGLARRLSADAGLIVVPVDAEGREGAETTLAWHDPGRLEGTT